MIEIITVQTVQIDLVNIKYKGATRKLRRRAADDWQILIDDRWQDTFFNLAELEEAYQTYVAKRKEKRARVRKGAVVWQDFRSLLFDDDTTVFKIDERKPRDGWQRLIAFGFGIIGGPEGSYGNGAIFVRNEDIISVID